MGDLEEAEQEEAEEEAEEEGEQAEAVEAEDNEWEVEPVVVVVDERPFDELAPDLLAPANRGESSEARCSGAFPTGLTWGSDLARCWPFLALASASSSVSASAAAVPPPPLARLFPLEPKDE